MKRKITFGFIAAFLLAMTNSYAANVTVRLQVSDSWTEDVYLYIWGTNNSLVGEWPGAKMEKGSDGFLSVTFDNTDITNANGIFNNNAGSQIDIAGVNLIADACFEMTAWDALTQIVCPASSSDVTVKVKVADDWTDDLYLYIWGNPNDLLGGWPGKKMIKDADGYYIVSYDASAATEANGILNNNAGSQIDIDGSVLTGGCFELTSWTGLTAISCPGGTDPEPQGNTTVSFKAPSHWEKVYVYTYSPSLIADFWGKELNNKDANGFYSYTFDLTTASINVMFHNGKDEADGQEKTDIFIAKTGNNCFEPATLNGVNLDVTEIDCPTTGVSDLSKEDILIYPNPVTDYVYVAVPEGASTISVYSALGRLMQNIPANNTNNPNQINLSAYPKGVYFITIWNNDGSKVSKTIIKL